MFIEGLNKVKITYYLLQHRLTGQLIMEKTNMLVQATQETNILGCVTSAFVIK